MQTIIKSRPKGLKNKNKSPADRHLKGLVQIFRCQRLDMSARSDHKFP